MLISGEKVDASTTQGVCYVICKFFDLLKARYNCAKFRQCKICVTDFGEGDPG